MSPTVLRHLLISLFLAIAGLGSALAQTGLNVLLNNTACPTATVTFSAGSIAVNTAGCVGSPGIAPQITSAAPTAGTLNTFYSHTFTANGSPASSWSIVLGTQPNGLSLSNGVLSGTPTLAGTYTFTVQAGNGTLPNATQAVALVINAPSGPPLITSSATLPTGGAGSAYNFTFTATGAQPITWSAPSAPGWATLNSTTGQLSGTAAAGSSNFNVTATNSVSSTTQPVTLSVIAPTAPVITGTPPATGNVNAAYAFTFGVTSGTAPITWSVASGALPTGVLLNPSTGVLSGTPSTAGTYMFAVQALNSVGPTVLPAAGSFTVTIGPAIVGGATLERSTGIVIPSPSRIANGSFPPSHAGTNGAGALAAWSVDPARCDNSLPAIVNSWHHNINFDDYRLQGNKDEFDMAPNESMTWEFTPTMTGGGSIFTGKGYFTTGTIPYVFITISTKPCDFDVTKVNLPRGSTNFCYSSSSGESGSLGYYVSSTPVAGYCTLTPGTKYYMNLRWQNAIWAPTLDNCTTLGQGRCGVYLQVR